MHESKQSYQAFAGQNATDYSRRRYLLHEPEHIPRALSWLSCTSSNLRRARDSRAFNLLHIAAKLPALGGISVLTSPVR
jgi:hypothetical protein